MKKLLKLIILYVFLPLFVIGCSSSHQNLTSSESDSENYLTTARNQTNSGISNYNQNVFSTYGITKAQNIAVNDGRGVRVGIIGSGIAVDNPELEMSIDRNDPVALYPELDPRGVCSTSGFYDIFNYEDFANDKSPLIGMTLYLDVAYNNTDSPPLDLKILEIKNNSIDDQILYTITLETSVPTKAYLRYSENLNDIPEPGVTLQYDQIVFDSIQGKYDINTNIHFGQANIDNCDFREPDQTDLEQTSPEAKGLINRHPHDIYSKNVFNSTYKAGIIAGTQIGIAPNVSLTTVKNASLTTPKSESDPDSPLYYYGEELGRGIEYLTIEYHQDIVYINSMFESGMYEEGIINLISAQSNTLFVAPAYQHTFPEVPVLPGALDLDHYISVGEVNVDNNLKADIYAPGQNLMTTCGPSSYCRKSGLGFSFC